MREGIIPEMVLDLIRGPLVALSVSASGAGGPMGMSATASAWLLAIALLLSFVLVLFGLLAFLTWVFFRKAQPVWAFLFSLWRSVKGGLAENPDLKELLNRYPKVIDFLKNRTSRVKFSGWPATLLTAAFLYVLLLYLGSVEDFLTSDTIVAVDVRLANLLYIFRSPFLTGIFLWVTLLGKWQIVAASLAAVSGLLFLGGRTSYIPGLWISVAGGTLFSALGKLAFHRPRPAAALYLESTWSFPSGHATAVAALYGFILFLVWRLNIRWRSRILGSAALLTVIAAVGFSRLYLGVHYLSDVWSGYLLGLLWVIIGVSFAEALKFRRGTGKALPKPPTSYLKFSAAGILAALALFYLLWGLNYSPPRTTPEPPGSIVWDGDILKFFEEKGISRYSETIIGTIKEPMSFIILARNQEYLKDAFTAAGWSLASQHDLSGLVTAGRAALLELNDPTAPMTPSFWEGKPHGYGFQKPVPGKGLRRRHHVRVWFTPYVNSEGKRYFLGTASLDTGMKWAITHTIGPDIDTEREFLFQDLISSGKVTAWRQSPFVGPTLGKNFAGDPFFTDGQVYVLTLSD